LVGNRLLADCLPTRPCFQPTRRAPVACKCRAQQTQGVCDRGIFRILDLGTYFPGAHPPDLHLFLLVWNHDEHAPRRRGRVFGLGERQHTLAACTANKVLCSTAALHQPLRTNPMILDTGANEGDRACLEALYDIRAQPAELMVPAPLAAKYGGDAGRRQQQILSVTHRYLLAQTLFNEERTRKPQSFLEVPSSPSRSGGAAYGLDRITLWLRPRMDAANVF
jgi:hypothetical protein